MTTAVPLATLRSPDQAAARLRAAGLRDEAAEAKAALFAKVAEVFAEHVAANDAGVAALFVPGRIEVVGKHTDYGGGRSLVGAVERGFCLVCQPRPDSTIRLIRADGGGEAVFGLGPELAPQAGDWTNYPMTVARRIARNFPAARHGADIAFLGDLPPASGLSSSSALVTAMFLALARANDLPRDPRYTAELACVEDLAGYLGAIENGSSFGHLTGDRGVGTFGGSEDHAAIIGSRPGELTQFAYCPVRIERRVTVPAEYMFVIGFCGAEAQKTGAARERYNRASRLASKVIEHWRRGTGRDDATLADAIASSPDAVALMRRLLAKDAPTEVLQRFEHFYAENEQVVPAAGDALARGDIEAFGEVIDRSQHLGAGLLGNQVPQTVHLAASARARGAAAASAFGAGFGGSVWALVQRNAVPSFIDAWSSDYAQAFPDEAARATWFATDAGPSAFWLDGAPTA